MTFDDAELLNKAAKAAGHMLGWNYDHTICWLLKDWEGMPNSDDPWNPLENDGDALRLAVKLGLVVNTFVPGQIQFEDVEPGTFTEVTSNSRDKQKIMWHTCEHQSDSYAATRRAIVRAAAAIGEKS